MSEDPARRIDTDYKQLMPVKDRTAYIFPVKCMRSSEKELKEWLLSMGYRDDHTESLKLSLTTEDADDVLGYMHYLMKKDNPRAKRLKFNPGDRIKVPVRTIRRRKIYRDEEEEARAALAYEEKAERAYESRLPSHVEYGSIETTILDVEHKHYKLAVEAFEFIDKIWNTGLALTNHGNYCSKKNRMYILLERKNTGKCPISREQHEVSSNKHDAYIVVTDYDEVFFFCYNGCKLRHGKKFINITPYKAGMEHVMMTKLMARLKRLERL